jgi:hypothetical protein
MPAIIANYNQVFNINDSESDSDRDSESESELVYEPDELSSTRYNIVLCELYNPTIHGVPVANSNVNSHYIVNDRFKQYNNDYIDSVIDFYNAARRCCSPRLLNKHPIFRNYKAIASQMSYMKPEIAECVWLPTNECVAVKKTFWIRLVQRTWRKVYKNRKAVILLRSRPESIKYRELTGRWPASCARVPGLRGMLYAK